MNDSDTRPPIDNEPAPANEPAVQPEPAVAPKPSTSLDRELAETKDRLLRTLADMDNMRKRTEREVADARVYGISNFARDILGVADNMHRAMAALDDELRAKADEADQGAARRCRADRARVDERAGKARREADRAARPEVRPQPPPGDVRDRGRQRAGGQRHPGDAGWLSDRRSDAAAGAGRGGQGRRQGRRRPTTIPRSSDVELPRLQAVADGAEAREGVGPFVLRTRSPGCADRRRCRTAAIARSRRRRRFATSLACARTS